MLQCLWICGFIEWFIFLLLACKPDNSRWTSMENQSVLFLLVLLWNLHHCCVICIMFAVPIWSPRVRNFRIPINADTVAQSLRVVPLWRCCSFCMFVCLSTIFCLLLPPADTDRCVRSDCQTSATRRPHWKKCPAGGWSICAGCFRTCRTNRKTACTWTYMRQCKVSDSRIAPT